MSVAQEELDHLAREDLILRARVLGVERAELMTRVELKDEIIRRSEPDLDRRQRSRGWLGVARDLVASVVEAGLNMRDAAALIRGEAQRGPEVVQGPAPVATVTLAEIYAAQGHFDRALNMIQEVLAREPDHQVALSLRQRLIADRERGFAQASRRKRTAEEPASAPAQAPADSAASEAATTPAAAPEPAPDPVPVPEASEAPVAAGPEEPALVVLRDGNRAYLYWELPLRYLESRGNGAPGASVIARTVSFEPSAGKPKRVERDLMPHGRSGGEFLPDPGPRDVLRAALGYRDGARFRAFSVASEVAFSQGRLERSFQPFGAEPGRLEALERRAADHLSSRR